VDTPVRLADGRFVWLRPLGPADADGLVDLRRRLSDETLRRRFLRLLPPCDPKVAFELANVDQQRRVALAVVPHAGAREPILGVGRFHTDGDRRAELALLVEDAYQQLGIGRQLLARLLEEAERRAVRVLHGYVLYGNQPVLHLLRASGHDLKVEWHGGEVLSIELAVHA
jgi:GNAT superfamily N-acetyltransferase